MIFPCLAVMGMVIAGLAADSVRAQDAPCRHPACTANPSFPDPALRRDTAEGDAVLQGFSFVVRDGGHIIEDIGLERRSAEYEAWYQDNQGRGKRRHPDDPFDRRADFVILR